MDATIFQMIGPPAPKRPEGFGVTVKEAAVEWGCSEEVSRRKLEEYVASGVLEKTPMGSRAGAHVIVYHRPGAKA